MNIQLNFDTEKDNLNDLKKVCAILQEIIRRRENKLSISELDFCNVKYKEASSVSNPHSTVQKEVSGASEEMKTAGGCRYMPYEDVSEVMSSIYKGKKRY